MEKRKSGASYCGKDGYRPGTSRVTRWVSCGEPVDRQGKVRGPDRFPQPVHRGLRLGFHRGLRGLSWAPTGNAPPTGSLGWPVLFSCVPRGEGTRKRADRGLRGPRPKGRRRRGRATPATLPSSPPAVDLFEGPCPLPSLVALKEARVKPSWPMDRQVAREKTSRSGRKEVRDGGSPSCRAWGEAQQSEVGSPTTAPCLAPGAAGGTSAAPNRPEGSPEAPHEAFPHPQSTHSTPTSAAARAREPSGRSQDRRPGSV